MTKLEVSIKRFNKEQIIFCAASTIHTPRFTSPSEDLKDFNVEVCGNFHFMKQVTMSLLDASADESAAEEKVTVFQGRE